MPSPTLHVLHNGELLAEIASHCDLQTRLSLFDTFPITTQVLHYLFYKIASPQWIPLCKLWNTTFNQRLSKYCKTIHGLHEKKRLQFNISENNDNNHNCLPYDALFDLIQLIDLSQIVNSVGNLHDIHTHYRITLVPFLLPWSPHKQLDVNSVCQSLHLSPLLTRTLALYKIEIKSIHVFTSILCNFMFCANVQQRDPLLVGGEKILCFHENKSYGMLKQSLAYFEGHPKRLGFALMGNWFKMEYAFDVFVSEDEEWLVGAYFCTREGL